MEARRDREHPQVVRGDREGDALPREADERDAGDRGDVDEGEAEDRDRADAVAPDGRRREGGHSGIGEFLRRKSPGREAGRLILSFWGRRASGRSFTSWRVRPGGRGRSGGAAGFGAGLFASTVISRSTSSESIVVWSTVAFQLTPKSLRLSLPVTSKPVFWPPRPSLVKPFAVTVSVTGFVTPRIVRSPVTSYASLPFAAIFVDLNVISGNFAVSKKSAELRCLSRFGTPVSMLVASIFRSTELSSGFARSRTIVPSNFANWPPTFETKWRTLNPISVWFLSRTNVSFSARAEAAAKTRASASGARARGRNMRGSLLLDRVGRSPENRDSIGNP